MLLCDFLCMGVRESLVGRIINDAKSSKLFAEKLPLPFGETENVSFTTCLFDILTVSIDEVESAKLDRSQFVLRPMLFRVGFPDR